MIRLLACVLALSACPGSTTTPKPIDDTPLRLRVAQDEAKRADGVADLLTLARGTKAERVLALRGLGRIGGPQATQALIDIVTLEKDPDVLGAAASALGLSASLDDDPGSDAARVFLGSAVERAGRHDVDVIEAIGRAADSRGQETLRWLLLRALRGIGFSNAPSSANSFVPKLRHPPPSDAVAIARASALALGRFGRRKIEFTDGSRDVLIEATRHADSQVRYAAAYALAREQLPKTDDKTAPHPNIAEAAIRLAALLDDADASVRAIAAQALARRKAVVAQRGALEKGLHDVDWRVAVEAVRALGGEGSDDRGREQTALAIVHWYLGIESGQRVDAFRDADGKLPDPAVELLSRGADRVVLTDVVRVIREAMPAGWSRGQRPATDVDAHVAIEGLRTIAPHAKSPVVRHMLGWVVATAATSTRVPQPTRGWIECLGRAALIRGEQSPDYGAVARCALPDHLRLPIVADVVAAKVGTIQQRREALRPLLAHKDARVRVAGMTALVSTWEEGDAADHRAIAATVTAALESTDGLVAGTAVEAAGSIYEAGAKEKDAEWRTALDAAVIARATREKDAELAASLFELIGKRALATGAPACREGLKGAPVLAKAAATCLGALGQAADAPAIGGAQPPPVDVSLVIGKRVRWKLETSRGPIEIELDPDTAPWAVATIATLTRKGFYDNLEFHRVVPNFVVQGGDPTQSGWGGPGFAMPAEPSSGAGYVEGGVGMADAGRDSAGSQWFIMHAPAPHLDGRYTWVGKVASGQSSANSLQIGDRVTRATIDISPRL